MWLVEKQREELTEAILLTGCLTAETGGLHSLSSTRDNRSDTVTSPGFESAALSLVTIS